MVNFIFFAGLIVIAITLLLSSRARTRVASVVAGMIQAYKYKRYGDYAVLFEQGSRLVKNIRRHSYCPDNIQGFLRDYNKNLKRLVIRLNKVKIIYDRVFDACTNQNTDSFTYIAKVFYSLKDKIQYDIGNLGELFSICERKAVDKILLTSESDTYDLRVQSLVEGLNELDILYRAIFYPNI